MNFINFLIIKSLVKTKYANIINIAAQEEVIPELIQSKCNPKNIFENVKTYLDDPNKIKNQVQKTQLILSKFKSHTPSSEKASKFLSKYL